MEIAIKEMEEETSESKYIDLLIQHPIKWKFDMEYEELSFEKKEFILTDAPIIYCLEEIVVSNWLTDGF